MSTQTLLYIILAGIIALLLALFQYKYKAKGASNKNVLFAFLRFLSVFGVLLLLINPKFEQITVYNEKPNLVIAVDNSNSIVQLDQVENAKEIVNTISKNEKLKERFNVDVFSFGNTLNTTDSLTFSEKQTNIDKTFNELNQIYKNTISPTIIVTDGNQTYGNDYEFIAKKYKQAIYPIIIGDTASYVDLKLKQLNVNKYAYLKNKFPVEAILVYNGSEPVNSKFVVKSGSATVYSQTIRFSKEENSKILNFNLPANSVGVKTYSASILPLANEKNKANNSKNFAVEVIDEQTKVAIVSAILHPDLGAIKKAIESNEQRTVSIVTPNTFLNVKDEFQLVILYQPNTKFKSVFEALETNGVNKFIIAGSETQWTFLNQIQDNFELDVTMQFEDYQALLNANFTTFIVDDLDFNSFPPLRSEFGDITFNTTAEILLYKKINNTLTDLPLLLTFENNNKREALLLGENIWKWRAQSYINEKSFQQFDNFIGKLVQYLATNRKRNRLNVDHESFYNGNGNIIISAQFFNKNYEFDAKASINLLIKNKETNNESIVPFVLKNNNYQADISGYLPGEYDFTVRANNGEVSSSGSFQILDYNVEQQFLNANVTKLQQVATNSKGSSYFIKNTDSLIPNLLNDSRYSIVQKSTKNVVPLIDFKYLLALIVLSLSIEWYLRKYNGLI